MTCETFNFPKTITVQSPGGTAGAGGHADLTDDANWTTEQTIKARFLSRGGREGRVFDQVQGEVSHIIETPSTGFSRTIQPSWRLRYADPDRGTRTFNIISVVDVDEARRLVQIQVTEVV